MDHPKNRARLGALQSLIDTLDDSEADELRPKPAVVPETDPLAGDEAVPDVAQEGDGELSPDEIAKLEELVAQMGL